MGTITDHAKSSISQSMAQKMKRDRREWKYLYAVLIFPFFPDHAMLMFRVRIKLIWIQAKVKKIMKYNKQNSSSTSFRSIPYASLF